MCDINKSFLNSAFIAGSAHAIFCMYGVCLHAKWCLFGGYFQLPTPLQACTGPVLGRSCISVNDKTLCDFMCN